MGGICGFSVKRSSHCYISIDLLKIEPGLFPEGELGFRSQDRARHEQVQVGDRGMKTMGHQPYCPKSLVLLSNQYLLSFFFFLSLYPGWSSKTSFIQARASSSFPLHLKASWKADLKSDII